MTDSPEPVPRQSRILPTLAVLLLLAVILAFWLRPRVRLIEFAGGTMGTTYSVKIVDPGSSIGGARKGGLANDIHECLENVTRRMSTYLPDSELSRFNQHEDGSPFRFSEETFHVFKRAMEISELTSGAFDITVGPIVNAYGFGPETRPVEPPSDEKLEELKRRVGYRLVQLDSADRTVRKLRPDVYCDLSAIAKGYAVDRVAGFLDQVGITDYMIEVGGEVRVRGFNAEGKPWRIGLEKPADQGRAIHRVLGLSDKAIASSGDYRNYYMAGGVRISHIIDPRTGRSVSHNLALVSIIADDCETADALATAFMVLGPVDAYNLAEQNGVAALFLTRNAGGEFEERVTGPFESLISAGHVTAPASRPAGTPAGYR
ncbi:MAG TPA: FAD:protein FMN transferase [Phycisphaerae bacterium]|nr:FAD:protein FMN transferase [Phycisphaerae bacterium]